MKVVLFCGGMGMRLRDFSETVPKPLVPIGYRPILWHVMKYYAYYGHHDFVLCLGYKADVIKNYFLDYNECLSNDFLFSKGGKNLELLTTDIDDWRIAFVDTGVTSKIGQRLKAVEKQLRGEEMFLANYSDGLSDVSLPKVIDVFQRSGKVACLVSVKPRASFHLIKSGPDGIVRKFEHIANADLHINGGFFVFRREIFKYLADGEDLVGAPMDRLIADGQLITYPYDGFWACMDTFKEKQELEDIYAQGRAPWAVWNGQHSVQEPHKTSPRLEHLANVAIQQFSENSMKRKKTPTKLAGDEKRPQESLTGPMPPERFLELIKRCRNRKEWGFCNHCQVNVRVTESDGQVTEGILDKTLLNSVQLVGHIPFNVDFVKAIEIVPPFTLAPCIQASPKV